MNNQIWTDLKQGTAPKGLRWLNTHRVVINPDYRELLKAVNLAEPAWFRALLFSGHAVVTGQKNRFFIRKPPKFLRYIATSGHPHGYAG